MATRWMSIMSTTIERLLNHADEESTASWRLCAPRVHRAFGPDDNRRSSRAWGYAHDSFGTGKWEARNLPRNGREVVEGFRRERRRLAGTASPLRSRPGSRRPHQTKPVANGVRWAAKSAQAGPSSASGKAQDQSSSEEQQHAALHLLTSGPNSRPKNSSVAP